MKTPLRITGFFLLLLIGLNQRSFGQCTTAKYATLPYTQDFESWITLCDNVDSLNVPDSSWVNIPASGDSSWRRNDQGAAGSWGSPYYLWYYYGYGTEAYHGSHSAAFDGYDFGNAGTIGSGALDLYVNCSTVKSTKLLSFYYINPWSNDSMNVYLSTNGGLTFSLLISCDTPTYNWTNYTVPIVSDSAKTIISFVTSVYGVTFDAADLGLDYVQVLPPCQDKPYAGSIVAQTACPGPGESLMLPISSQAIGLSYAWQQSGNNSTWSSMAGNTLSTVNVTPATSTYYRAIVTCISSGLSDTSASSLIPAVISFYRNLPYTEDFESWMNRCDSLDVPDTGWTNTPSFSSNSWRRDDQGGSANWQSNFGLWYNPYNGVNTEAYLASHSAAFDATDSYAGSIGTLDLYVNCSTVKGTKLLSFYYTNPEVGDSMNVYVSTDGGVTFSSSLVTCQTNNNWTHYTLPIASDSARTVISFIATADYGSYDMGLDLVQVLPPCQDKPSAGTIPNIPSCSNPLLDTLLLSGNSLADGLSYAWQQSADSINWSTIAGDTSLGIEPLPNDYYRVIVTCKGSGLSDTTTKIHASGISKSFFRNLPYTEDFESWINHCGTLDVPDTGWVNIPATGNNSWRRDDQGELADWETGGNQYNPASFSGSYSACFNAANTGNAGTLYLYVNCSRIIGTKELSFYYINPAVADSMNVYVSTDGGVTFSSSLVTCKTKNIWTNYIVPIVSDSAETVISFVATADNGNYDMGLDLVQVLPPPCEGKPVAGITLSTPTSLCSNGEISTLTLPGLAGIGTATGLTYQWQSSIDNINWANVTGGIGADSDIYITDTIKATTFYRCIVTCSGVDESDTSHKAEVIYSPLCYCPPQTTVEDGDNIGNVTIKYDSAVIINNGIDTPAIQPNLLITGTPYIICFDSLGNVINLQQGLTYTISTTLITNVSGANNPDTAYVFIDYNQDGEWEPTERVWSAPYNLPTSTVPVPTAGTFTVPLTADTGLTEMRIQLSYLNGIDTPCYNSNNTQGETEDYLVHIAKQKSAGIDQVGNSGSIEIYPDPFSSEVTLYFDGMPSGDFNVAVTNIIGQSLMEYNEYTDGSAYKRIIDLHTLPAGVYFISVIINSNNYVTKVVKMD